MVGSAARVAKPGVLASVFRLVDRRARAWMTVATFFRLGQRLLLAGVAVSFAEQRMATSLATTVLLALLAGLWGASRSPLLAAVRARFSTSVTQALFDEGASPRKREETELLLFDALAVTEDLVANRAPGIIADAIATLVIGVFLVAHVAPSLLATAALVLVVAALASEGARRVSGAEASRSWKAFVPFHEAIEACLHGGFELVANGRARAHTAFVDARAAAWIRSSWRADWLAGLSGRLPLLLGFAGVTAAIAFARSSQGLAPSRALPDGLLIASFLPPFAGVLSSAVEVARMKPKLRPLADLLDRPPVVPTGGRGDVPALPAIVRWDDLAFSYAEKPIFEGLRGEWKPGELLGISGPNGSGKSTFLRLLLGMAEPSAGGFFVGDERLVAIDGEAWRAKIAFLPQQPYLLEAWSIREAMRFLCRDATDAAMREALVRLGLDERLARSDDPLAILVGSLSAGERQRVALARLLLRDSAILFLDEPDATLDTRGLGLVGDLLRDLAKTRMVAFIAHDEHLLARADRVLRF